MVMRHCRTVTLLTAAVLTAALLSPAAADEGAAETAQAVATDADGATAPAAVPAPARIADETAAPAQVPGVGYAKTRVRHAARYPRHVASTYRPATRVAWVEAVRPIRSILFLGVGF